MVFVDCFLCSGIMKQISASSAVRKLVALTFIRVSLAYMEYKRIYEVCASLLFIWSPKCQHASSGLLWFLIALLFCITYLFSFHFVFSCFWNLNSFLIISYFIQNKSEKGNGHLEMFSLSVFKISGILVDWCKLLEWGGAATHSLSIIAILFLTKDISLLNFKNVFRVNV